MISLILPYWQRQEATDTALAALVRLYPNLDLEVIVVDDGSPVPYQRNVLTPWPLRVLRLTGKSVALNPCVPINAGVAASNGEVIVLSNPEILHRLPVLEALAAEVAADPELYVAAACWCPDRRRWHCHSSRDHAADDPALAVLPPQAGYHFCAALSRTLWDAAGGFDPAYRDGPGWDDADFLLRLQAAGARFRIRDDLVVEHPIGNRVRWSGVPARNRRLFLERWGKNGDDARRARDAAAARDERTRDEVAHELG